MEAQQATGAGLLKTLGACLVAPIVFLIVTWVVGAFNAILMHFLTVIRPGIIEFVAVLIGTTSGMFAARMACDKLLSGYNPQVIFVLMELFAIGGVVLEVLFVPFDATKINSYIQLALVMLFSYQLFWRYEPIDAS